mgnify:CR=1 FL=1
MKIDQARIGQTVSVQFTGQIVQIWGDHIVVESKGHFSSRVPPESAEPLPITETLATEGT